MEIDSEIKLKDSGEIKALNLSERKIPWQNFDKQNIQNFELVPKILLGVIIDWKNIC